MAIIENQDIIITGLQSWDIEIGSNCKNLAVEFSKDNRVLYVNPPTDRFTAIRKKIKKTKGKTELKEIKKNLWVYYPGSTIESISRLPLNFLFDALNKSNNKTFAGDIKKAIVKLNFSDYIHFCDSDMFRSFYLKDILSPKFYIYYTRDNLVAVKYWQTQGNRIEPQHMAKADLVVANSTYLADLASAYNKNSFFVGQGCDLSTFSTQQVTIPEDIANISNPRIGYIGALKTLRLDIGILEHIARSRPDWSIVLVGPEDEDFRASKLHQMKNVWFLGRKDEGELPAYLSAFDVAINPQTVNEITIGNYPRKIDEYLAMGKPVVGTRTQAMNYFKEHVSLAGSKQEWIQLIEKELHENSEILSKKRRYFANDHTWGKNTKEIYKCILKSKRL